MASGDQAAPSVTEKDSDGRDDDEESQRFIAAASAADADGSMFDAAVVAVCVKKNVKDIGR